MGPTPRHDDDGTCERGADASITIDVFLEATPRHEPV